MVGRPGLDPGTLGLKGRRRLINTSQGSVKSGNRRPFSSDVSDESSPYAAVRGLKWGLKIWFAPSWCKEWVTRIDGEAPTISNQDGRALFVVDSSTI